MPGNPNLSGASVHPFHRSGAITENPRPARRKPSEQPRQIDDGEQVPVPPGQAQQQLLSIGDRSNTQNFGVWRDQLLAEIEVLAEALKKKVARYSLLREAQSSGEAAEPDNETAMEWIQDALEDVAATALGIEIASRELLLRAASAGDPDSNSESAQAEAAGSTE